MEAESVVRMRICWFGGEPTLRVKSIARMQTALLEKARIHKLEVPSTMIITNGYLLDGKLARQLKELEITEVQVTLDGPEAVHNKRRKLANGRGSYRRIVENLAETAPILNVGVRINVDRENAESAYEVIDDLDRRGILSHIHLHFAQVKSYGVACANVRDRCFCEEDFSKTLVNLYKALIDRGVYKVDYPQVYGGVFCGAVSERCFVISPNGLLFNCWEELSTDPEKSIGDIFSPELTPKQHDYLKMYNTWDPFKMKECLDCSILPMCLGGCPLHGMSMRLTDKGICSPWKFNLTEMLKLRYLCDQMQSTERCRQLDKTI
jgi:uncharacterized protein